MVRSKLKSRLLRGFFWRWLFFISLFLLNIGFSRYFGAAESGNIYFITNTLNLYLLVITLNLEQGIGFYAAFKPKSIHTLLVTGFISCIFSILVLLLLQNLPLTGHYFIGKGWPWYYPVIFIAGNCIANFVCPLFYAKGNYILPNALMSFFLLFLSALFIAAEYSNFISSRSLLELYFWLPLVQSFILLSIFLLKERNSLKETAFSLQSLKLVLKYSIMSLANSVLFFLLLRVDYWLVEHYTTQSELGNYIQVSKFGQLLFIAPTVFSTIILPRVADGSIKNFNKTAVSACAFLLVALSFVFIVLFFAGPSLFVKIMGADYTSMYTPALIKIPAILLLSFQSVLGIWFAGKNKLRYNLYCSFVGLIAMIIANMMLIPLLGINGASLASLVAYALSFITAIYFYRKL